VSLTAQLREPTSPLARFMAAQLPRAAAVAAAARAQLGPAGPLLGAPLEPGRRRPHAGTVGTALDLRIRYAFAPADLAGPANGLRRLHRQSGRATRLASRPHGVRRGLDLRRAAARRVKVSAAAEAALRELDALAEAARPWAREQQVLLDLGVEDRMLRLCMVAAAVEELWRAGIDLPPDGLLDRAARSRRATPDLPALVDPVAVQDLRALLAAASRGPLSGLRDRTGPQDVISGPRFAGSTYVDADADLLVGSLLLEIKTTGRPRETRALRPQQLAGYVLLDWDDACGIEHVGIYLARLGRLLTWPVGTYLALLAGRAVDVSVLRRQVHTLLTDASPAHPAPPT
jgi:hypothetical protein